MSKLSTQFAFIVTLISMGAFLRAELEPGVWINPVRLHQALRQEGPAKVDRRLRGTQDGWAYVMANISLASPKWLQVAVHMRPGLRGSAYREWAQALNRALGRQPAAVLAAVNARDVADICTPETEQILSLNQEVAARRINGLIRAVQGVHDRKLQAQRRTCLKALFDNRRRLGYLFSEP